MIAPIIKDDKLSLSFLQPANIYFPNESSFLITKNNAIVEQEGLGNYALNMEYIKLINKAKHFFTDEEENIWVVSGTNELYKILPEINLSDSEFRLRLLNIISGNNDTITMKSSNVLDHDYKSLKIRLSAPFFIKESSVKYIYYIDKDSTTHFTSQESTIEIPELSDGKHKIFIYAVNSLNERSVNTIVLNIKVKPPFWKSIYFLLGVFVGLSAIFFFVGIIINKQRLKKADKRNQLLEDEVHRRTFEIKKQNALIKNQNEEIKQQNEEITVQNEEILVINNEISIKNIEIIKQNKEIKASIRYASKIQQAVLPFLKTLENHFSEYFVMYEPRDVVSGDFYWVNEYDNRMMIVAADCTGHGVPGGFLSMLGMTFLNEIVNKAIYNDDVLKADDILNSLREKVISSLRKSDDYRAADGMDLSLVIINTKTMTLNYAGANNPIYIIRDSELYQLKADRMPIGLYSKINPFTNHDLNIQSGDTIYLMSDGYQDQFGGPHQKKFSKKRLEKMLLEIQDQPLIAQKRILTNIFKKWKKASKQIDDVLFIGLKIFRFL